MATQQLCSKTGEDFGGVENYYCVECTIMAYYLIKGNKHSGNGIAKVISCKN